MLHPSCPTATVTSTGTAADGGWQRWWEIEARRKGTDWRTLLDCADAALQRLRAHYAQEAAS
jgi:hypothetical protein